MNASSSICPCLLWSAFRSYKGLAGHKSCFSHFLTLRLQEGWTSACCTVLRISLIHLFNVAGLSPGELQVTVQSSCQLISSA